MCSAFCGVQCARISTDSLLILGGGEKRKEREWGDRKSILTVGREKGNEEESERIRRTNKNRERKELK